MIDILIAKLHDVRFMTMLLAFFAASATVYTLVMPLLAGGDLNKRMKAVASERVRIIVAIKNCSRFFRNCASNAEAHLVVAQMPQDRQSAGATHVTYLRAANHLDALVNKLS